MDFYRIATRSTKNGTTEIYPSFTVGRSTDLMVRGGCFYAIWDENQGLWSTDEYDVARLVDAEMHEYATTHYTPGDRVVVKDMRTYETQVWSQFKRFLGHIGDNSHTLDQNLTFSNTLVKQNDYVSKRLPYALEADDYSAWAELSRTLYLPDERSKLEWAIGAIVAGDSKKIQKFVVVYGPPASGKSTMLNIIEKLFVGYTTTFEARSLSGNNNQFATEVFKGNPLVAIQHDGDLSRIEDNTKLNSIISHEEMTMNEKFKSSYTDRISAFLFMGTNQPVRISDAKSGIIRRLIDVHPSGETIPINHYHALMSRIDFELGAIASHCLEVYRAMGKNYYSSYRPLEMMLQTDVFFNFIEANYDIFKEQNGVTLTQGYLLYKAYCDSSGIDKPIAKFKVREELRNYFDVFHDRVELDGVSVRSYYQGFNANKFKAPSNAGSTFTLVVDDTESLLDAELAACPAQLATKRETPKKKWEDVTTTLADIDTSELHFVKVPYEHIVVDFDLKGEDGEKSLERNLEAASVWPDTYAELSKSGAGVHLHYIYDGGDPGELASRYSEGIEVKVYRGDASLRRRLSKCNHVPVATINSGLPLKEKKLLDIKTMQSEKSIRDLIARTMKKEFHAGTKSSVDFIKKILDDAYESGMPYDVTDLREKILWFAQGSSNQAFEAIKVVQLMHFQSKEAETASNPAPSDDRLVFFDVEVYPNLFVICWKYRGDNDVVRMINPTPQDVEALLGLKLVGFYNRRYDNHMVYARINGYSNEQLYELSTKILQNKGNHMFGEAYGISYADIWDFSSKKQSLKKFEIDLGVTHMELDLPWDEPVPEEDIPRVVEYCVNDVLAAEATFDARAQDFVARQILAELSGMTVNDTTAKHTSRIIFGQDRNPQSQFVYTDLSKDFPGYVYDLGKSYYREELVGEGGYVYAEPGMYENVAVLDIASMHPTSIEQLNLFGEYTGRFSGLKEARMAIKHKDYDTARKMLGGKLAPYLRNEDDADALAYALKIVINTVYGLTSAKFDNPFRDIRNKDNIVAKRGALFMIDLKHAVQEEGFTVAHIKTDSIKIPNATPEICEFVIRFGEKYGYEFEQEAVYEKFCLVNDAVYIAKKSDGSWEAVGAQFQHPYVYKTLFTHEPIVFSDLCETKQVVKGAMYLDFEFDTPMVTAKEGLRFVGNSGRFVPVEEGQNGAVLYRVTEDKPYAVTGTKGYLWLEADMAASRNAKVNMAYFDKLADDAASTIWKFGNYDKFVSQDLHGV